MKSVGRLVLHTTVSAFLIAFCAIGASADARIAFVDLEKALSTSRAGVEAQKQFEAQLKKAQTGIDSKKGEVERMREAVNKQKDSLNAKALAERQEEILNMEKGLKRNFEDKQDELRKERARLFGDLVKRMKRVVDEVGKAEGFTVILEKNGQGVLYADSGIDITDQVVKKFDAQ